MVGIGEAGLDYHYDFSPREAQAQGFRTHIAAARETGLPLVIHSREAEADTARILEEEMGKGAFKPLLHCFTSKAELARRGLALGGYVSFSGILTYKTARGSARYGGESSHGPAAGRNRRAISGTRAVSRQDQRAGLRGEDPGDSSPRSKALAPKPWRGHQRQLLPAVCEGAKAGAFPDAA